MFLYRPMYYKRFNCNYYYLYYIVVLTSYKILKIFPSEKYIEKFILIPG